MSFFNELKRRNVFRVAAAYVVAGWLLMQVTDVFAPALRLPEWFPSAVAFLLLAALPVVLFFAWAYEITPEGIKKEAEVERSASITRETAVKLDRLTIALIIAAIAVVALDRLIPERGPATGAQDATAQSPASEIVEPLASPPPAAPEKSIAVLPFVNMSGDPENEYFSDGISEEILNALAKVDDLKVAGRTSSFAFKGENQDLRRIGEALGVQHILEGSVRKAGHTVRITAQLIQVEDGFHLWSETYDRQLTNVFAIQDEIALAILGELKAELLADQAAELVATTTDPRAYDQFLLAKQRIYDRSQASLEAAVRLLDAVLEIDPEYAPAHAQRAIAVLLLHEDQYGDLPEEEAQRIAREYIDRALALDPNLAEAWAAQGLYLYNIPGRHMDAIEALQKALSINPNLINASNWLQNSYRRAGMSEKTLPILEGMLERDPLYRPALGNAINEYNRLGMQERSFALIERVRPFIPDDAHLVHFEAATLTTLGRYAEALPLSEEALAKRPADGVFRLWLGFELWNTHQYERAADPEFSNFIRIFALQMLGRTEEAGILAQQEAAKGDPNSWLEFLNRAGRSEEAARYIDERWPDLADFEAAYPTGQFGYSEMIQAALAYSNTGNDAKFQDAMQRVRAAHDRHIEQGVRLFRFFVHEGEYYALAGDFEKAIEQLEIAIDQGWMGNSTRLSKADPALQLLEGDPRYEALQARAVALLNEQRAQLGLEPSTI